MPTPSTLRDLLPADARPPTPGFVVYLAELSAAAQAAQQPTTLLRTSLLGAHMPGVLALVADLQDRLAQIADNLTACPEPARGGCPHGTWPCVLTESAWLAAGLDPAEQIAARRTYWLSVLAETPGTGTDGQPAADAA